MNSKKLLGKIMIIGNGLVGNAFFYSNYNFDEYIIFASGVSNSKLEDKNEFNRELTLIKKYIDTEKFFIYFSSIHMLDPSQNNSMYVQHKIQVEELIKKSFKNYIIYRLPLIMGKGGNDKSLFNYLHYSITNHIKMNIFIDSYRYIMDIDDVVELVFKTLHAKNKTINLVFNKPHNILDIINIYEKVLKQKAIYSKLNGGDFFKVDNSILAENISQPALLEEYSNNKYLEDIINKYYLPIKISL